MLPYSPYPKVAAHCKEQNIKIIMSTAWKTKKLFKVKKCQKNAQKLKIISLKIHKGAGI